MVKLSSSNCFVLIGERTVLVDTGAPGDHRMILRALDRQSASNVSLILLTHAHSDHAGSCVELKRALGVPVACSAAEQERAASGQNGILPAQSMEARLIRPFVDKPFSGFVPDIVLGCGDRLDQFGIAAEVLATPGHTAGSLSVICESGDAVVGDVLMGGYFGGALRPSLPNQHYFCEDRSTNATSINRILQTGAPNWHVGHGGPLSRTEIIQRLSRLI